MEQVKILVVEDEAIIADNICSTLKKLDYTPMRPVSSYTRALQILEQELPDLILLDIQLAGRRDGVDLAWKIKDDYNIPFIFLTSHSDPVTIERAKKVSPSAYLVKPFNKEELYTSIEIALYNYTENKAAVFDEETEKREENNISNFLLKNAIFVKQKQAFKKIFFKDILYLKSEHVYVNIITNKKKEYLIRSSMSSFLERLPDYFFQTQRSYVINLHAIEYIHLTNVRLGGFEVPLGSSYRTKLLEKMNIK